MAALQRWRRAYGALKDSTTVGLANLNSDYKELDVAIVKATNHYECPSKERHIKKILLAISGARPQADVAYCVRALARRLTKTRSWTVALKTLIVIQRILKEGDPIFRDELVNFSQRGHILQLSNFKDDSSPIAWDCSAWVRTYAQYLGEKLEFFRALKYDVTTESLIHDSDETEKGYSRTRTLETEELLNQLPVLQQLLYRLIGCRPEGAAANIHVIHYALALVLKESFKIYCAINDGIINLVDKFFDMPRHKALRALEAYKKAVQQAGLLSDFYEECRSLEIARNFQFPRLKEPPQSFLATMEEYIKEAPTVVTVSREALDFPERLLLTYKPEDAPIHMEAADEPQAASEEPKSVVVQDANKEDAIFHSKPNDGDLLGLNDFDVGASAFEESNALALATIPAETRDSSNPAAAKEYGFDPTGWELALITTSSNLSSVQSNLAGGLDKLALDGLYDNATYGNQPHSDATQQNPFLSPDLFGISGTASSPPSLQMTVMAQPQQQFQPMPTAMQLNPFTSAIVPLPHLVTGGNFNPFADAGGFNPFTGSHMSQQSNPFGTAALL